MSDKEIQTMSLWSAVEKSDPKYIKDNSRKDRSGNVTHKSSAINAAYQIKQATTQFGPYGSTWGLKDTSLDFSLMNATGMALYKAVFYYPGGQFEINNAVSVLVGKTKYPDSDFAKKVETDTLTKALSKLGFNADIFMGQWDDQDYVNNVTLEKELEDQEDKEQYLKDKYAEIKESVKKDLQMFDKLPTITTLNGYAGKIKAKVADKLVKFKFPPNSLDTLIEGARQNRENQLLNIENEIK